MLSSKDRRISIRGRRESNLLITRRQVDSRGEKLGDGMSENFFRERDAQVRSHLTGTSWETVESELRG